MPNRSYWERTSKIRVSRRQALSGAAALGAGAVALSMAGCGSGGGNGGNASDSLAKAVDTSKDAVRGGTYLSYMGREPMTLDAGSSDVSTTHTFAAYYFSRLLKIKSGPGVDYDAQLPDGDFAESWNTPDGLTWTFKIRQGKMQNVPPVNARPIDSEDVKLSWDRFMKQNPKRGRYTMIDSVTTPDAQTVVYKLKYLYAPFQRIMADPLGFWVMPKEYAQEKLDPRNTAVGSGPWILDKLVPSSRMEFRRNADYWDGGLPYIDRIEMPLVTETAQQRSQFLAKNTYIYTPSADDVWPLHDDFSAAQMWKADWSVLWPVIFFGRKEFEPRFQDIRLRRALAMSIDRDEFIDVFYGVQAAKARGASVTVRWSNVIAVGWPEWLDPKSKDMGYPDKEPGKWYKFDPAEAKKMVAAAGYPDGLDAPGYYYTGQSSDFMRRTQVTVDSFRNIGVRLALDGQDYYTKFIPDSVLKGNSKGVGITPSGEFNEVDVMLYDHFMPQRNYWDPPSQVSGPEGTSNRNPADFFDQEVYDLIEKQRRTLDYQERKGVIWDIQKKLSSLMWEIPWNGEADTGYTFTNPVLKNYRVWRGVPDTTTHLWLDQKALAK